MCEFQKRKTFRKNSRLKNNNQYMKKEKHESKQQKVISKQQESIKIREKYDGRYWKPVTENGEFNDSEFDKRFSIDRTYQIDYPDFLTKEEKTRIRFVKHPECKEDEIKIFRIDILISKPADRWLGGGFIGKNMKILREYRDSKITNSSEKIMRIKDVEEKYGIKLQ